MTTVPDGNVHCISVDGSFDDCQSIMKAVFADLDFKQEMQLGAVNSVNWARVLAQIVYYGYASLRQERNATFCVPTGNFGNIFAGYLARRMGFPIADLVLATNENDILARFFNTGEYARGSVHHTLSPAMDIQVASNFERFLYFYFDCDSERLTAFMQEFQQQGSAALGAPPDDAGFIATAVDTQATLQAMREVYERYQYVMDPHTAVGYAAAQTCQAPADAALIVIATAHPAKFPEAVGQAVQGLKANHPTLDALADLPERKVTLPADIQAVKDYIRKTATA